MTRRSARASNSLAVKIGLPAVALAVLAACGGGGGDSTNVDETVGAVTVPSPPASTAVASNATTGTVPADSPSVSFDEGEAQPAITNPPAAEPEPSSAPTEPADPLAVRPESADSPLPEVPVLHLQTGDAVQLKNLLPASKPLLVWFWAPH